MKVKNEKNDKIAEPLLEKKLSKKQIKSRDLEQRKKRKEERALKFLQNTNPEIKPAYKKGFHNICGVSEGRSYTVSIAVPASILDNAQTFEYKCLMIAQIARAAAIYSVDEIVVYDEEGNLPEKTNEEGSKEIDQGKCLDELLNAQDDFNPCVLMAFILKYMETPEYLRKSLFPQCASLSSVNILPPLAIPSHLRSTDHFPFREGIVLENSEDKNCPKSNIVDIGLDEVVEIDIPQDVDSRITVKYNRTICEVVTRDTPRIKIGAYWGYRVRMANQLSGVTMRTCGFNDKCGEKPTDCKYDLIIGTSEKASNIDNYVWPKFQHLLMVFGGRHGLEHAISVDKELPEDSSPKNVFNAYLNTCPVQTSRTIRTEESVLISLGALRTKIFTKGKK